LLPTGKDAQQPAVFASSNKAVVTRFIAAFKEATQLAISSNADSNEAIKTYVKITDPAQLDGSLRGRFVERAHRLRRG
jgi:hypothetical protein